MKKLIVLAVALLCLASCRQDSSLAFVEFLNTDRVSIKVKICHLVENGKYELIEVNENSLDDHFDHGDAYPNECIAHGQFLDPTCNLVDVSQVAENCENEVDDNCNGLFDRDDEEFCTDCPCYDIDLVFATNNITYYNSEVDACAGPFIGFSQEVINYGVNPELNLALSPTAEICTELSPAEVAACRRIIIKAQETMQLPNFCSQFTNNQGTPFFSINSNNN